MNPDPNSIADQSSPPEVSVVSFNEQDAIQLVDQCFPKLIEIARRTLWSVDRRSEDEDDIVQSAFRRFLCKLKDNRFPDLHTNEQAIGLLKKITRDRAIDLIRSKHAAKRGGGQVRGGSALENQFGPAGINGAPQRVTSDIQQLVDSEFEWLMGKLGNDELRKIALLRFEAYSNEEIATQLECSIRTVERRLELIRKTWEHHISEA